GSILPQSSFISAIKVFFFALARLSFHHLSQRLVSWKRDIIFYGRHCPCPSGLIPARSTEEGRKVNVGKVNVGKGKVEVKAHPAI
ncbi:MAG TPA: hypothetical protein PLD96_03425, partial [Methanothrix sp.]|nr:hypothetical protein [Methanothrix sp.]